MPLLGALPLVHGPHPRAAGRGRGLMRSRLQLELNPGDYQEAQKRERRALLEQLTAALDRAFSREEPWYMWVLARRNGEHRHDLQREDGTPIACPVPGCDARRTLNVREAA